MGFFCFIFYVFNWTFYGNSDQSSKSAVVERSRRLTGSLGKLKRHITIHCGERGAEPKGKTLRISVSLNSNITYGHELWVATERTKVQVSENEMSSLWRATKLIPVDRLRSFIILKELRVEACSSTLKGASWGGLDIWLGCLLYAFQERYFEHVALEGASGQTQTCWREYSSWLAWECLCTTLVEPEEEAGEREISGCLLKLLDLNLGLGKR